MERKESNNYEKMRDRMAKVFLRYDQEKMIQKFNLEYDENNLYLCFLNRPYRISRQTGRVTWSEDGFVTENPADYNAAMTIYDVLCCSKEDCCLSQEWVSVGSLSSVLGGTLKKEVIFSKTRRRHLPGRQISWRRPVNDWAEGSWKKETPPMNCCFFLSCLWFCVSGTRMKNFRPACRS